MISNSAAWIEAPFADLVVRPSPVPTPGPGQVVVQVRAVAVNPLDAIIQSNGRLMYRWLDYPVVLGEDVAGVVVAVGEGVHRFAAGDRLVAYATGLEKGRDHVSGGGFQHLVAVDEALAAPIPDHVAFEDAVVLPLALSTAAAALFETSQLGLDHTRLDDIRLDQDRTADDEVVVVWGGSTSVGGNAVQLARAAGYRVITTASPQHHGTMQTLGAEAVFDYRADDVVASVVAATRGARVVGVVAIAVGSAEPCVEIAAKTGARRVALTSPSVSFYDQPRRPGLAWSRVSLMARLVWSNVALQARCLRHGVRARFVWGSAIATSDVGPSVWSRYLPRALAEGRHQLLPRPQVVGTDLGALQGALDTLRGGVSAQKLVVSLPEMSGPLGDTTQVP
ncbi:alcohol dehydrogenase catalytic domain-containing protein [Sanguibacter inulinus]|uniref:Alcohol dehydrogenase catalytic domain-containing protein n=1 Tax=Sanguibacter inulinus TaxID=60922 RepID=A0A853EQ71_9MICO|nr:alcohol dehydrogenase catalytic domain-containing protein [Sanguibacter inulinus]MBF0721332.1 alcohol dehydrogenase catalytic domain-containing protein [Sanguibacter inulinus]NYS92477.1 alcohol dehydrogenase catalytic domain-containing protein [Sanguibacter inulinus]